MTNLRFFIFISLGLLADQLLKVFIPDFSFGFFNIEHIANEGIVFGILTGAPALIRTIAFSCFFIFMFFLILIFKIYFLQDEKLYKIHLSLCFILTGIIGNGIDRIRLGYVVDFFNLKLGGLSLLYLNLADVFLAFGLMSFIFLLFKFKQELLPTDDDRTFRLIDPHFQLGFSLKLALISLFSMVMMGAFSFSFFKIYISNFDENLKLIFVLSWSMIACLIVLLSFLFGLIISGRTVGPIFAFERTIKDLKMGKDATLTLRKFDSFKRLEKLSCEIKELLQKK